MESKCSQSVIFLVNLPSPCLSWYRAFMLLLGPYFETFYVSMEAKS